MTAFDQAVSSLPDEFSKILLKLDLSLRERITELRIHVGRPAVLILNDGQTAFFDETGQTFPFLKESCFQVSRDLLERCILNMCDYSLHSVQNELLSGFLTLKGGHRAGFCGNIAWEKEKITHLRRIDHINLRIARCIKGSADPVLRHYRVHGVGNTLIVGPPASGKTTVLRDLCRALSSGDIDKSRKISLIDERGEIAACYEGIPQYDVGWNTDVFDGYTKLTGTQIALRCMSPDIIICDEIGGASDSGVLNDCANAGVSVIATAHASGVDELLNRTSVRNIIRSGAFDCLVFLNGADRPGTIREVVNWNEVFRDHSGFSGISDDWTVSFGQAQKKDERVRNMSDFYR